MRLCFPQLKKGVAVDVETYHVTLTIRHRIDCRLAVLICTALEI